MTREEKEQIGKYVLQMARLLEDGCYQQEMLLKAVHIIDETLEQEPCEDAISRQAVLEMAYDVSEIDGEHFTEPCMVVDVDDIQKLPPVNPQPKTGHWIGWGKDMTDESYKCSKCGELSPYDYDFCPHCGIKNGKCTYYEDEYMEVSE